eukprot:197674-Hanusia_phi.AAC.2
MGRAGSGREKREQRRVMLMELVAWLDISGRHEASSRHQPAARKARHPQDSHDGHVGKLLGAVGGRVKVRGDGGDDGDSGEEHEEEEEEEEEEEDVI